MIVSTQHKFVFVQVPKAGSTSIKTALQQYQDYPRIGRHVPLRQILDKHPELTSYFKFGVTRNHEDWADSCYRWARRKQDHPTAHRDMTWEGYRASNYQPNWFNTSKSWLPPWHACTPSDWLWGCDYIMQFERLDEDWKELCNVLDIPHKPLAHMNQDKHKDAYTTIRSN